MNIAIIPARKGSKRIKNKNRILLHGKPLIYWTIKAAKKTRLFSNIYVDTDCNKIKKLALRYGAEVPFLRPIEISDDLSIDFEFIGDRTCMALAVLTVLEFKCGLR